MWHHNSAGSSQYVLCIIQTKLMSVTDICKPLIVDLLRTFDKNRWISPKIRYASVRSKSQLLRDIEKHFTITHQRRLLHFAPRAEKPRHPRIEFDLDRKEFLFGGRPLDLPEVSRAQIPFAIRHGNYVVWFDCRDQFPSQVSPVLVDEPATRTKSGFSQGFPKRDTGAPGGCSGRTEPSSPCA